MFKNVMLSVLVAVVLFNTAMLSAETATSLPAVSGGQPSQSQITPPYTSGDPWERMEVARKLATSRDTGPAITALVELLGDDEAWVRAQAAESLGSHGAQARSALKPLLEAKADEDLMVRRRAGAAIAKILLPGEYEVLEISDSVRREENKALLEAVDKTAQSGGQAASKLIAGLKTRKRVVRKHITEVLAKMGPAAVPTMVAACQDEDVRVRTGVTNAVRIMGTKAVPSLSQILRKGDERQRADAAFLLGQAGGKEARQSLLVAREDVNETVREEATYALEHMPR